MRGTMSPFNGHAASTVAAFAVAMLVGTAAVRSASADETQAKALFKAMTDYMAAQKAIAIDYDSNLEIVSRDHEKFGLASSGTLTIERPDKVHVTRDGGFADVEVGFDGKTLTMLGKNINAYTQVDAPGTVDHLVGVLRDKYHRPVPGADLIMSDPYAALMNGVTQIKDLGSGVIRGQECNHLAARSKLVDWQIWIAQGDRPYPCRYVVTSAAMPGSPQYTIDIRSWKTGSEVAADTGKVDVANARKVTPIDLPDFDELPAEFSVKVGSAQ